MISFKHTGDFRKTTNFLEKAKGAIRLSCLDSYGRRGVAALSAATPVDSGNTAGSWSYEITRGKDSATITFHNSNENEGCLIAILLQYGHGTGTGGYVAGRDYINPAIQPVFDELADAAWKEVTGN